MTGSLSCTDKRGDKHRSNRLFSVPTVKNSDFSTLQVSRPELKGRARSGGRVRRGHGPSHLARRRLFLPEHCAHNMWVHIHSVKYWGYTVRSVLRAIVLSSTVLYCSVLCCIVLSSTVLYCTYQLRVRQFLEERVCRQVRVHPRSQFLDISDGVQGACSHTSQVISHQSQGHKPQGTNHKSKVKSHRTVLWQEHTQ